LRVPHKKDNRQRTTEAQTHGDNRQRTTEAQTLDLRPLTVNYSNIRTFGIKEIQDKTILDQNSKTQKLDK